jgi:hypothetical protein
VAHLVPPVFFLAKQMSLTPTALTLKVRSLLSHRRSNPQLPLSWDPLGVIRVLQASLSMKGLTMASVPAILIDVWQECMVGHPYGKRKMADGR